MKSYLLHNTIRDEIKDHLISFDSINLGELDDCRLMSRFDRKFPFPVQHIPILLDQLGGSYSVLEVEGRRLMKYRTQYYDTANFDMYLAHHNNMGNRFKIRLREYEDTGLKFLEVKDKNNKGEVSKYRTPVPGFNKHNSFQKDFIRQHSPFNSPSLEPGVVTSFNRFTLVNFDLRERITIDSDLSFNYEGETYDFPAVAVAEIKSAERNLKSPFFMSLRELRIKENSFSKYCIGTALLRTGIRKNIFKPQLKKLNQLQDEYYKSYRVSFVPGNTIY